MLKVHKLCCYITAAVLLIAGSDQAVISQSELVYNPENGNRLVGELYPYDTLGSGFTVKSKLPYSLRGEWHTLCAVAPPASGLIRLSANPEDGRYWSTFEMRAKDMPNPSVKPRTDTTLVVAGLKDYKVSTRLVLLLDSEGRELGWIEATGDLAHVYAGNLTSEGFLEFLTVEVTGDSVGYSRILRYIPNVGIRPIFQTPQFEPLFIWRDCIRLTYSNLDDRPLIADHLPSVKLVLLKQLIPGLLYREVYQYSPSQQNYVERSTYYPRTIAPQYRYYTGLLDELRDGVASSAGANLFFRASGEIDEVKYSQLVDLVRSWKNSSNIEVLERIADNY